MNRILVAAAALGLALELGGCASVKGIIQPPDPQINDRVYVLGPDAVQFCNGWVQLWARVDTTSFLRDVELYIKATPGNEPWNITNEHILVEHPKEQRSRRRLRDIKQLELQNSQSLSVPSSSTDIARWELQVEGLDPSVGLKVFLRPFEGCTGTKSILGVVIRDVNFEQ